MIIIATKNVRLGDEILAELERFKVEVRSVTCESSAILAVQQQPKLAALVVDDEIEGWPGLATTDFLNGLGQRLPVLVIAGSRQTDTSDIVTVIQNPSVASIVATLEACGALGTHTAQMRKALAFYNPHLSKRMLVENRSLGVLTIDASSFRKIEVEYGSEVYRQVKEVFQGLLNDMWGRPGCFRASDVLCRRSDHGNLYYVFLNRSRTTGSLPLPGVMEDISDRLARIIQNSLLSELYSQKSKLPDCIASMPKVVVGYGSAIHNPCLDPYELVSTAIDHSAKFAQIQHTRNLDRYRELMMTLIQSDDLLVPHYQGVFRTSQITVDQIKQVKESQSFAGVKHALYAFEALIRVRVDEVRALMGSSRAMIDPKFLRPDVLFETAKSTKVALELDQACLQRAIQHSHQLPGWLMVNILPRNLYYIKHLKQYLESRADIILEVSESESINNFELVDTIRSTFSHVKFAADDFGRAFAGLDRVIQMRPELIKFDRSLIENIHLDPVKLAYVKGLVESARLLKTEVLAEGVEKIEEFEVLASLGIDYVQGFLIHRPQDVQKIIDQLQDSQQQNIPQAS